MNNDTLYAYICLHTCIKGNCEDPHIKTVQTTNKKLFFFPECVFDGGVALYDVAWLVPLCVSVCEKRRLFTCFMYGWLPPLTREVDISYSAVVLPAPLFPVTRMM